MRQQPPLGSRTWKPEEEDYLMEKWGQISVPAIAKKLNRTTNAVKVRAQRLGLGAVLMAGEYVTLNQLLLAVTGGSSSYGYKMKSWVENRGLWDYGHGTPLYGWHISGLRIYDMPRDLGEFQRATDPCDSCHAEYTWECTGCKKLSGDIKRPPQSWCYVLEDYHA